MPSESARRPVLATPLRDRLARCTNLPSPPGVAMRIIALGQDPGAGLTDVAQVIERDPALAAKVLRVANSPFYGSSRRVEDVRRAVTALGMDATMSLALSVTVANGLKGEGAVGLDTEAFWRRAVASATACAVVGEAIDVPDRSHLVLAGLLADIGMLALERVMPDLYRNMDVPQQDHERLREAERAALGADHAAVGAWLLEHWNLPESLVVAVAHSHGAEGDPVPAERAQLAHCVAVAGELSGIWSSGNAENAAIRAGQLAERSLGLAPERLAEIVARVRERMAETAAWFDVDPGDAAQAETLEEEAKEILLMRNLWTIQVSEALREANTSLESQARNLAEENSRDGLTGVFNRAHFDTVLEEHFAAARAGERTFAVAVVDMDHFKGINDTHGHPGGDAVLRHVAGLLAGNAREGDVVARYGGEEFVLILPALDAEGACRHCEALLTALRAAPVRVGDGGSVRVTASIGVAACAAGDSYERAADVVVAADRALYAAKHAGRDRAHAHRPDSAGERAPTA